MSSEQHVQRPASPPPFPAAGPRSVTIRCSKKKFGIRRSRPFGNVGARRRRAVASPSPDKSPASPAADPKQLLDACSSGDRYTVEQLLGDGVPIKTQRRRRPLALHLAAGKGHTDLCAYLVEQRADVHAVDSGGQSSLHRACDGGHLDVASLLHEFGASLNLADGEGRTPLSYASASGAYNNRELCEWLKSAGAKLGPSEPQPQPEAEPGGGGGSSKNGLGKQSMQSEDAPGEGKRLPPVSDEEVVNDVFAGGSRMAELIEGMSIEIPGGEDDEMKTTRTR